MKNRIYFNLVACGGLAAIASSCSIRSDGSKSRGAVGTSLDALSIPTVTTLGTCNPAAEGEVVFLTSTGMVTLETCNGTAWVATACTPANIDQVLYVASLATFETCTGMSWIALPFSATALQVGTGPASIAGTVLGPSGPVAGASLTLRTSTQLQQVH